MSDNRYCMIYIKLSKPAKELKQDLNVKFNYQKDEWFLKIKDVDDLNNLSNVIYEQEYIDIEGINMSVEEIEIIIFKFLNIFKSI